MKHKKIKPIHIEYQSLLEAIADKMFQIKRLVVKKYNCIKLTLKNLKISSKKQYYTCNKVSKGKSWKELIWQSLVYKFSKDKEKYLNL
jgi:uncharacterized protein YfiM (DUF2279 family)